MISSITLKLMVIILFKMILMMGLVFTTSSALTVGDPRYRVQCISQPCVLEILVRGVKITTTSASIYLMSID